MAAVRLPVATETRLIVLEVVSSTQSEPAPKPSPQEPSPIPTFFTTLFVFGLIFRRYGAEYSLTHTKPPPAAAAQGDVAGATWIFASTVGDCASPEATDARTADAQRAIRNERTPPTIVRLRNKCYGS